MKKNEDVKKAINELLKSLGIAENVDEMLHEKLPCGHTVEEHAAAKFLTTIAAKSGMSPKVLLGAAKTLVENEEHLLAVQAEMDAKQQEKATINKDNVLMAPMPKEMQ